MSAIKQLFYRFVVTKVTVQFSSFL